MADSIKNPIVDEFLKHSGKWRDELTRLRELTLGCRLTEELKWGKPCYTFEGKNIVLIHGFKEYCALLFFKGALLKDPAGILIRQTGNVQAGRQIRFTGAEQIAGMEEVLRDYILEAVAVEAAGLEVPLKKSEDFIVPEELQTKFVELPALKTAFDALTPGRQRAYLLFFASPKQAKTREARVEKYTQQILAGKGLND